MAEHSHAVAKIDVAYVARLARLDLSDEEIRSFQEQLDHIVEYVKDIQSVNITGVEPMAHAIHIQNVFREDEEKKGLDRETVLANAPVHDSEQFLVPKIV